MQPMLSCLARSAVVGVMALFAAGSDGDERPQATAPAATAPALVLSSAAAVRWDAPIQIMAESAGVEWHGGTYHLLTLSSTQVTLADRSHLTAKLKGAVVTFDNVDYQVSAAVFDAAGALLGSARATCHVDREWLGHVLTMSRELELDFGLSNAYPRAAWVTVGISECDVLTPDQWQKDG